MNTSQRIFLAVNSSLSCNKFVTNAGNIKIKPVQCHYCSKLYDRMPNEVILNDSHYEFRCECGSALWAKKQVFKTCSCGHEYDAIPKGVELDGEGPFRGYYWNCDCGSTMFHAHNNEWSMR